MQSKDIPLNTLLDEYTERNSNNMYQPVAIGKYGIRKREDIYSKELTNDYSNNKLIYKNTLTVGMGSKQMDIGILTDDAIYSVSPAYHTYKIKNINSEYLKYCLECRNSHMFSCFVKRGSRQGKTIDLKRWLSYEIPICDHKTQLRIVKTLNKAQQVISLRKQQLDALDTLIKARFVEMFGDPEYNTNRYPVVKLSDISNVGSSKRIYQNEQSSYGIPFLRISDLSARIDTGSETNELYIPVKKYEELSANGLVPISGDILITSRGTLGKCYIIKDTDRFYFQDGMISWLSDISKNVTSLYISYLFKFNGIQKQIANLQAGSTVAYLSISMLKKLDVMIPPLNLQNEFAAFVSQVDKSKFVRNSSILTYYM